MNDEYNCPPVCPKCQRCHRGECEPKPQTPLTDALIYDHKRITTIFSDVVDFARSLEIKLQEAQSKATKWDDLQTLIKCDAHAQGKDTPMDVLDQLVKKLAGLKEAEHQRDEANKSVDEMKDWCKAQRSLYDMAISNQENWMRKWDSLKAERDQLIKVCDELASCCGQFSKDGGASAIHAYSLLPHVVIAKKGNKQ